MPLQNSLYIKPKGSDRAIAGKTVVKLFTQDGVRELLIPSGKPNYHPVALTNDRLRYIEEQAAKKDVFDSYKIREQLANESKQRREHFRKLDSQAAAKSAKLSELDRESKEKANYLLKRAWELRMEQEDEVKAANSLILKTKCQAIRDAQLAEKLEIKRKLQESDKRIERLMEEERVTKLLEEKRKEEVERSRRDKYILELTKQIEESQLQKLHESEEVFQERKHLNKAMYLIMLEEAQKRKEDEENKLRVRMELAAANEQIRRAHALEKEESRLADLKVQEWMRQRAEREETLEKEQLEAKRKRELEITRLRAMQEKAGELQAQQERMVAVRRQEEHEREWRKKEKLAAEKHKKMEEECLIMREKQLREIRQMQAMEIAREKRELERNVIVQKECEERERQLELKRRKESEEYREDLLRQMNEKEANIIEQRKAELDEGVAIRAEAARREDEVRKMLTAKVSQMRTHRVPDMYVVDVMRQLHLTENDGVLRIEEILEANEKAEHVLCICEAGHRQRLEHLHSRLLAPGAVSNIAPGQVVKFVESLLPDW